MASCCTSSVAVGFVTIQAWKIMGKDDHPWARMFSLGIMTQCLAHSQFQTWLDTPTSDLKWEDLCYTWRSSTVKRCFWSQMSLQVGLLQGRTWRALQQGGCKSCAMICSIPWISPLPRRCSPEAMPAIQPGLILRNLIVTYCVVHCQLCLLAATKSQTRFWLFVARFWNFLSNLQMCNKIRKATIRGGGAETPTWTASAAA